MRVAVPEINACSDAPSKLLAAESCHFTVLHNIYFTSNTRPSKAPSCTPRSTSHPLQTSPATLQSLCPGRKPSDPSFPCFPLRSPRRCPLSPSGLSHHLISTPDGCFWIERAREPHKATALSHANTSTPPPALAAATVHNETQLCPYLAVCALALGSCHREWRMGRL